MAGTTVKRKATQHPQSDIAALLASYNLLVADVELLRAALVATCVKLDADAGVTDTTYAAQATVALVDTAAELLAYVVTPV